MRFNRLELDPAVPAVPSGPAGTAFNADVDPMKQADRNRRMGLFEEALRCYSRALELDRSLVVAWAGQVQMLVAMEEYPEAELWSRKALELFRDNADLLAGRAHALMRTGDLKQAQALCDASLAQREQSAYRWLVRGELMLCRREAMEQHCFNKAEQVDGDWLMPVEIAQVYLHHRLPAKAITRARRAVEKAPDQAYAWYVQACCEAKLNLIRQAQQSLMRCLELQRGHAAARRLMDDVQTRSWSRRMLGWIGIGR